jgi:DNA invertase Pin-like site-specific DNA recombinase
MKAALYLRVSTEEQTTENQRLPLVEHALRNEWDYEIFTDVVSGSKQSRTGLDRLMQRLRNKEFGVVAVVKLDRLGRNLKHLLQLIEEFRNKNVQFVSLSENIDTNTPQGRLFLMMAGAFAEYERELIRERSMAGQARARKQGKKIGRPKGSKDKKARRKSGYWLRWAGDNKK